MAAINYWRQTFMSNHHVIREYVVNEVHKPVSLLSGVELSGPGLTNLLYYTNHPRYSSVLPQTAETRKETRQNTQFMSF